MARTGSPATRHLAAVERATRVLDALAAAGGELGTNELAAGGSEGVEDAGRTLDRGEVTGGGTAGAGHR